MSFERLRELFHACVELEPEERERFLAALPAVDSPLLDELRSLLRAEAEAGDALFAAALPAEPDEEEAAETASHWLGRRIGPWQIDDVLGRGGMGEVLAARRADGAFDQQVALKVIRREALDQFARARFRAERQLLARLGHPAIARLIDGGTTDEGLPYLVMERVAGEPIDAYCRAHGLDVAARLRLFAAVCAAVEYAHRNLVVHRDLKPSNILVSGEAAAPQVKLLDFGIAKLLAPGEGDDTDLLTRAGSTPMTVAFASPEQVRGDPITTASDVYSLGVLLYVLLTGEHPYALRGAPITAAARIVCEQEPVPPSQAAPRLARALRGDLDTIVLKALRKEPGRRYGSVEALAEDLQNYLEGRPVAARPDSLAYRAGKFARRHRVGVAAAAAVVLALVAGAGAALWQARRAREERDRAQAEARRSTEMASFLRSVLTSPDPVRGRGRQVTVAELLADAARRLGTDLADQPAVEAELRGVVGETYRNLGLLPEAERAHRSALELLARLGAGPLELGRQGARLAYTLNDQGRWEEAEDELRRALDLLGAAGAAERGPLLDALSVSLQNRGLAEAAIAAGREAVENLRAAEGADPMALASALNNLGIALGNHGEFAAAEALHRESVAIVRAERGERHPLTAMALANLAGVVDLQGRYAEAEPLYRQALALQEELLGTAHLDYLRTLTSHGNLLLLMGRPEEAVPVARRAFDLTRAALGPENHLTAYAQTTLGLALVEAAAALEAEPHLRAALETRRRALPTGHWLIASAQVNLGACLLGQGRYGEAERELAAAHAVLLADRGPDHDKTRKAAELLVKARTRPPRAPP